MTNQTLTISRQDLVEILMNVDKPMFVSMVSKTPVEMNKFDAFYIVGEDGKRKKNPDAKENPFIADGIYNLSRKYKIITGFDYEHSLAGRFEKEEKDFQAYKEQVKREPWFEMVSKGLVTDKKTHTKMYFRYQYLKDSILETEYLYKNDAIGRQLFESWLSQSKSAQDPYAGQGLDNPLQFQVCNTEHILEMAIEGTKYIINQEK